jgi:signal transduction histidine kinase
VAEWDGLENRCPTCRTEGSNPSLSAIFSYVSLITMKLAELIDVGVHDTHSVEIRRQIVFSNAVYWIVSTLMFLYCCLQWPKLITSRGINFMSLTPTLILITALICLLFNKLRYFLISKMLFVSVWVLMVMVFPIVLIGPKPLTYFQHPYFGILFSPVLHLLFSFRRETVIYIFLLIVFFVLAVFSPDFLLYFDRSSNPSVPFISSLFNYRINLALYWLFINLLVIYILRINRQLYQVLETKNDLIREQNHSLDEQREQLAGQNKLLETKVAQRTRSLLDQHNSLREYAFMHAHILRAPISRIKGLVNLLNHTSDQAEMQKILKLIEEAMQELEIVARSMSEKLNQEQQLSE